mgnify:FL=1
MSKLSDATPYLAMAALAATGVGLAGAGAAAGASAGTAAAAGGSAATGLMGTYGTGAATNALLAGSAGSALAPAGFMELAGMTQPAISPLATDAAMTSLAPKLNTSHFMGETYGAPTGLEGVTRYGSPYGTGSNVVGTPSTVSPNYIPQLDRTYAPVDAMTPKSNYPFMGREMESAIPQWMDMSSNISPVVEEGTKTLMDQLGIGYGDAFSLASQFYGQEPPPNFQAPPAPTSTGRQYQYQPSTMAQIMDRTRGNYNRQIRRSTV